MSNSNIQLARRWFEEVWNQRRVETIDELLTPESIGHLESGDVRGVDEFKAKHAEVITTFPDLRVSIDAIVADGDNVVVRWTATANHSGDGAGVDATQSNLCIRGMTWQNYRDGKLIEGWDNWGQVAMN